MQSSGQLKGRYGIDAPYLLLVVAALLVFNLVQGIMTRSPWPFVGAAAIVFCAACGLYASRRGKFVIWKDLLDGLSLRGDERVLDIGCGRGAVLMLVAARLPSGRAVGIDIWNRSDQSGNSASATARNAIAEGVSDRVQLATADMTALPFADSSFDLVVSSLAMHNVRGRAARRKAIEEAVRVLRPGGRMLVADILGTRGYFSDLSGLRFTQLTRRSLGWRMWWSGPWLATRAVQGTKAPSVAANCLRESSSRARD